MRNGSIQATETPTFQSKSRISRWSGPQASRIQDVGVERIVSGTASFRRARRQLQLFLARPGAIFLLLFRLAVLEPGEGRTGGHLVAALTFELGGAVRLVSRVRGLFGLPWRAVRHGATVAQDPRGGEQGNRRQIASGQGLFLMSFRRRTVVSSRSR